MLFNSFEFALFLPIVFLLYWLVFQRDIRAQNAFILVVSYMFYGAWDWRFLILIAASSLIDYVVGLQLEGSKGEGRRRTLLLVSIIANLGLLFVFKYFGFFVESFVALGALVGMELNATTLGIILPVGISFYTLQTMSYTIDIYRKQLSATRDPIAFFAFVAFFPQLVAGPIERAKNLLPQFFARREFSYESAKDGVKQILWGLFKKIAVADVIGVYVDQVHAAPGDMTSGMLLLATIYFAIQVYADFSGYSDIAIGTARLLGFNLMVNFKYPFFARDIAEFWRRWHISLTSWFRDYVYIPLGGNKKGVARACVNTVLVFVLSGLWHGAAWTYVLWGVFAVLPYLPLMLSGKHRAHLDTVASTRSLPTVREVLQMVGAFFGFALPLIVFRTPTVNDAVIFVSTFFSSGDFSVTREALGVVYVIMIMFAFEWAHRHDAHPLQLHTRSRVLRAITYFVVLYLTIAHVSNEANAFIYFQF